MTLYVCSLAVFPVGRFFVEHVKNKKEEKPFRN